MEGMIIAPQSLQLAIVSSAYNEEKNIQPLYIGCIAAISDFQKALPQVNLSWSLTLVDNCSQDSTAAQIINLSRVDDRIFGFRNLRNYGPEPSFVHGLRQVSDADVVILLCADLQDPPSFALKLLEEFLTEAGGCDAVLASKARSVGSGVVRFGRRLYYLLMDFSNRDHNVVPGYHGFGCYDQSVIDQALWFWDNTTMNMRACLRSASSCPKVLCYDQPIRIAGASSYSFRGYFNEACTAIFSGKSIASRVTLRTGILGLLLAIVIVVFMFVNKLSGQSGYASGIVTLALLVILSSAIQVIMLSLVSRQIEFQKSAIFRPRVQSRSLLG